MLAISEGRDQEQSHKIVARRHKDDVFPLDLQFWKLGLLGRIILHAVARFMLSHLFGVGGTAAAILLRRLSFSCRQAQTQGGPIPLDPYRISFLITVPFTTALSAGEAHNAELKECLLQERCNYGEEGG